MPFSQPEESTRPPLPLKSIGERHAGGKALREKVPRATHAGWSPPRGHRDPVDILMETSRHRIPEPLPIRYRRMAQSPSRR